MRSVVDGPASSRFTPLHLDGGLCADELASCSLSEEMRAALPHMPWGRCVSWGISLTIERMVVVADEPATAVVGPISAEWLIFLHTSDRRPLPERDGGFISPMRGRGQLGEHAADYVVLYEGGAEERVAIRRRHEIGAFQRQWGENCVQAVAHHKPRPMRAGHEQTNPNWGRSQTRADAADGGAWVNWLCAWRNPRPDVPIVGLRFEPVSGAVVISAVSENMGETIMEASKVWLAFMIVMPAIFLLGVTSRRATGNHALIATVVGWLTTGGMLVWYFASKSGANPVSFMYVGPPGLIAALVFGYGLSRFSKRLPPERLKDLTLWTQRKDQ